MRGFKFVLPLALMACERTGSSAFVTRNGVRVNPVNEAVFEVLARPAGRASDFWCGAGNYARRALDAPDTALVYVVGGAGPGVTAKSPDAAQFSLTPPARTEGATGRAASWGPELGASATVGRARRSCRDLATSSDD
ncbi:hypothetical protein J7399_01285 [Shimia sp. R9_1]|uniref:hypothetical protein n=1 Tax=Shimia sp. R9_1 TaxID=2821111 RepID=UPI001ADD30E8|nr:hypothetical protein [Shimia sp. R9_1]MBO9406044.1 hypothetical protein [Shimia sp. R9_1]